ncbi:MAG: aminoacyl-tRNA hydrolase [Bacteroides sp.]|nr:aminoacyl-tRNA hydrolase [Bacteroides sp.]MCM1378902.1 aminoacyl-tRNA hydrolase [Bacteroides sp.]MCM1445518.1 aminoacyl-tRNA hydrolase [Prevotella sp.]
MKYLIVGLGNIGAEYHQTRHNIGFMILDAIAMASNISFSTERYGDVARGRLKNKQLVFLKPSTYMNLSGEAVRYWTQKEKIPVDHILIVVDDLALPFGAIRIKANGSDAGHNGLKNIAAMLGTQAYPRLRFGIGSDFSRGHQIDYVLSKFSATELEEMKPRIELAIEAIKTFVLAGIQTAMCNYNNK